MTTNGSRPFIGGLHGRFRLTSWLAVLTLLALTLPQLLPSARAAVGDTFTDANFKYKVLTEEGTTGTVSVAQQANGIPSGDVTIPTSVTHGEITYNVTTIGKNAFQNCTTLTSIEIPDSVTSIGERAFSWCTSLTSVVIPDSVTSMGEWAFNRCTSMTSVKISNSVTSIEESTFFWCTSLTSVVIPDSVTSIGTSVFSFCESLTSVVISDSVTSIGKTSFYNCPNLTSVVMGNSMTSIGDNAFAWCNNLTSVVIPNSVTSMGDYAFYNCTTLTSIYFKGNAPWVGYCTLVDCPAIVYYLEGTTGWSNPWNGLPTAVWVPEPEAPTIKVSTPVVTENGDVIFELTYQGTLQWSTDMKNWQNVEGATGGTYQVKPAQEGSGVKFYRFVQ